MRLRYVLYNTQQTLIYFFRVYFYDESTLFERPVYLNYKKGYKKIVNQVQKSNMHAQEAGAEISMIKTLLRKIKFEVRLKLVRGHEDPTGQCNTQRLKYLIKECDLKASKARENVLSNEITTNINATDPAL